MMSFSTLGPDAGPTPPAYRLREVSTSDPESVAWAARLHLDLFSDIGFIAQLGERILRRVCYGVLVRDGLMKATIFEVDGQPAGLAAYTTDSKALHAAPSERYLGLVIREILLSTILEPRIIAGFPGALRLLLERRHERIEGGLPIAEFMALGVLAPYRTPEFVRSIGARPGDLLLDHALAYFREAGIREARGIVLADNRPALMFFRMRASRVEPYPKAVNPSYQVWFNTGKAPATPPVTAQSARTVV
jgi:hypothetical protein